MTRNCLAGLLMLSLLLLILPMESLQAAQSNQSNNRPNILFILADDLGWKDVSYHGGEINTPNIDGLAAQGVRLEQFYVMPVCTPTRASLMTGRYPIRYGLQKGVILPHSSYGLPLEERTLPQALKDAGYQTAIVGKWHLGHHDRAYLPTQRGFDYQYGHYLGMTDYFTHTRLDGLDWHRNDKALREEGYTTNLIGKDAVRIIEGHQTSKPLFLYVAFNAPHTPLQALPEYLARYAQIKDEKRRTYAAMVACMDDQIGHIIDALNKRGMMGNTLIVFSSDNGGPVKQAANNGTLRGEKGTLYEGGLRVPAWAVWTNKLKAGRVISEPLHMVDWYPTLLKLAGVNIKQPLPLDGKDIWPTLTAGKPSPHEEILHNAEENRGAIRRGAWKLVFTGPLPDTSSAEMTSSGKIELFNIANDPVENINLAEKEPERARELLARLSLYAKQAAPAKNPGQQPKNFKAPDVWGEAVGGGQ